MVKWIDHDRSKYQINARQVNNNHSFSISQNCSELKINRAVDTAKPQRILDLRHCLSKNDKLAIISKGRISIKTWHFLNFSSEFANILLKMRIISKKRKCSRLIILQEMSLHYHFEKCQERPSNSLNRRIHRPTGTDPSECYGFWTYPQAQSYGEIWVGCEH